jgi:hypothetical protein
MTREAVEEIIVELDYKNGKREIKIKNGLTVKNGNKRLPP